MIKKAKKKKVLVVTGTRAEYGLLKSTITEIQKSAHLELILLVTGMHTLKKYGSSQDVIQKDGIPITVVIPISERDTMIQALSKELKGIEKFCQKVQPDLVLVLGDRDEPFAAATVAVHLKIPVAHIHGGDTTGLVVDEYLRHAVTKMSHLHFTVTHTSYQKVLSLGESRWRTFNVGAPGLDSLRSEKKLTKKQIASELNLDYAKDWLLLIQHPVAFESTSLRDQIRLTLGGVESFLGEKIIIYPNTDAGSSVFIKEIESYRRKPGFHLYANIPHQVFVNLLRHAKVLVGNSSSGILEAGYFRLPAVNIGNRQRGRVCEKNVVHVPYDQAEIIKAIQKVLTPEFRNNLKIQHIYGKGMAGRKIVRILERYISHPNLFWK